MGLFDVEANHSPLAFRRWPGSMRRRAPDVGDWAGELYERCADDWRAITLDELRTAEWLRDGDGWVSRALAEQTVSRLLERQGERG